MEKVVVFSCTNRPNSNTIKVSRNYVRLLEQKGSDVYFLDFCELPDTITSTEMFGKRSEKYAQLVNEFITQQSRFVFVVPEYNGSVPGILKTFLDSVHPREWNFKKACLVGVADGRAGNLRGMEHLTGILQYLKMNVYHNKLPISSVNSVLTPDFLFIEAQQKVCEMQIDGFLNY